MKKKNIKFDSIEMLTQTRIGNLVFNTAIDTLCHTNDVFKA